MNAIQDFLGELFACRVNREFVEGDAIKVRLKEEFGVIIKDKGYKWWFDNSASPYLNPYGPGAG